MKDGFLGQLVRNIDVTVLAVRLSKHRNGH
jgi:hypothetical protein